MFASNKYLLILLTTSVVLSLLIGGCSSSADETLSSQTKPIETPVIDVAETSTKEPTQPPDRASDSLAASTIEPTQPANPDATLTLTAIPLPNLTEQQKIVFENNMSSILTTAVIHGSLEQNAMDQLAGPFLIMTTLSPNYVNYMNNVVEKFDEKIAPLTEYVDNLSDAEVHDYVTQALADYGLNPDSPTQLEISTGETVAVYNPATGTTDLTITIPSPSELSLEEDSKDLITVQAITINPLTLEEEQVTLSPENVSFGTEDSIVWGSIQKLIMTIPGTLLKWSQVHLPPGVLVDASEGTTQGLAMYTMGLSGVDAIVASRPLQPSKQGRLYTTPNTYGAPEPQQLPAIPDAELENAMAQELERTLVFAVDQGDITQEEADALMDRYDDPDIIAVAKDPVYRAALMIAASVKETGGDMLLDVLLGNNSTEKPMRLLFEDDLELTEIFGEIKPWPTFSDDDSGILWEAPDGGIILILNDNLKNGLEPVQVLATIMPHEVIAHEALKDSISEELVGNLVQTLTWAKLVERDPSLLTGGDHIWDSEEYAWVHQANTGTRLTQLENLMLLILLNSQNPAGSGGQIAGRHVGVMSRHALEGYNTLPGNNVGAIQSYLDFIQNVSYADAAERGIDLDSTSVGGENFRLLLQTMFGEGIDLSILDVHPDPNNEPDFSELSTMLVDTNLQTLFTNDEVVKLARLMGLELASGTP